MHPTDKLILWSLTIVVVGCCCCVLFGVVPLQCNQTTEQEKTKRAEIWSQSAERIAERMAP